ncbi:MAG: VOC family protein [Pseudomonadota bacterium]
MSMPTLSYIAVAAPDCDAVCRFLGQSLGLARRDHAFDGRSVPFFSVGKVALGVFTLDDSYLDAPRHPGVHHIALAAPEPSLVARSWSMEPTGSGTGPSGDYLTLDADVMGGIGVRLVKPMDLVAAVTERGGPVDRIDHLGIASTDLAACKSLFVERFGYPVESTETDVTLSQITESFVSDKYGAVYHARPPAIQAGSRALFISIGDCELGIMADYDPTLASLHSSGHAEPGTGVGQSAIAHLIADQGPGFAHIALRTTDIDATLRAIAGDGWSLIDSVARPGGRSARMGAIDPANFGGGVLFQLVEPRP